MNEILKNKRLIIFLSLAFGISWMFGLIIYLTGRIADSPEIIPGTRITLALVLTAGGYMWGPAIAHLLTRLITKTPWKELHLKPFIKVEWKALLAGWFMPGILSIIGAVLFFLIFPGLFDPQMSTLSSQMPTVLEGTTPPILQVVILQTMLALVISAPMNAMATFGEEFGWRAFLLPELMPLGKRKALIISSIIWGVWHWPMILMGHNYGLDYPGYPWLGLVAMVWFTLSVGIYIGWLSIKGRSVWPAVLAHGSLNGLASIGALFLKDTPPLLFGPTPAGLIGCIPFTIIALWILLKEKE